MMIGFYTGSSRVTRSRYLYVSMKQPKEWAEGQCWANSSFKRKNLICVKWGWKTFIHTEMFGKGKTVDKEWSNCLKQAWHLCFEFYVREGILLDGSLPARNEVCQRPGSILGYDVSLRWTSNYVTHHATTGCHYHKRSHKHAKVIIPHDNDRVHTVDIVKRFWRCSGGKTTFCSQWRIKFGIRHLIEKNLIISLENFWPGGMNK